MDNSAHSLKPLIALASVVLVGLVLYVAPALLVPIAPPLLNTFVPTPRLTRRTFRFARSFT